MARGKAALKDRIGAVLDTLPPRVSVKFALAAGVFAPLAPLVRPGVSAEKRPCRLQDRSLPAIWGWIAEDIAPSLASDVVRSWTAGAVGLEGEDTARLVQRLQSISGEAMRAALDPRQAETRAAALTRLGDEAVLEDAEDAAVILERSADLAALFAEWPEAAGDLEPRHVKALRRFCEDSARKSPRLAALAAALAASRMSEPAGIAAMLAALARRRDAARLDETIYAPVIEALLDDVAGRPDAVRDRAADFDAEHHALAVIANAFDGHVRGPCLERLICQRARLRTAFDEACAGAARDVAAVLEVGEDDAEWPPRRAPEAITAAVAAAGFLGEARALAATLGAQSVWDEAAATVRRCVRMDTLSGWMSVVGSLDERSRERVLALLDAAVGVTRGFRGDAAGDALERQVKMAQGRPDLSTLVFKLFDPMIQWGAGPKTPGRIAVSSLDAAWNWVGEVVAPDLIAQAEADLAAVQTTDERQAFDNRLPRLRVKIGAAMRELLDHAREEDEPHLVGALGERGLADTREIAHILSAADHIALHMGDWPPRIDNMNDERLAAFRCVFDSVTTASSETGLVLLFHLFNRLEKPAQILRVLARTTRHGTDVAIEATDYGVIGEMLLDRAETLAATFEISNHDSFDVAEVTAALGEYAGIVSGMTDEFRIRPDGPWGRRLIALRGDTARLLEGFCQRAAHLAERVTPRGRGWRKAPERPDVSSAPDREILAKAAAYARFVTESRANGARAAFAAERDKAAARIRQRLDTHVDDLVRIAHEDEVDRARAIQHLEALEPVVRAFDGDESADLVLRRLAAA